MSTAHSQIISAIPDAFERGKASGDLLFFPSEIHTHSDGGIDFQIRLCPALLQKPTLPTPHFNQTSNDKLDPFKAPYNPNLYVGELKDDEEGVEYVVLLNKFSVVSNHILLITKEFQSQSSPLHPGDLVQAYLVLRAARKTGKPMFAFYNCGDRSGASQAHKHIQFIPVDEDEDGPPIELLSKAARIEKEALPFSLVPLPFANHVRRLSIPSKAPHLELESALSNAFLQLLDLCISTVRHDPEYPPGTPSYNVILTLEHLYIFPRRQEIHKLRETGDLLSVNALGFAGLMLVKSPEELEAVKKEGPLNILKGVGVTSVHDLQVAGGPEFDGEAELAH
ncbi:ATP adenylyltransferase [Artomyces pyxidatus]|uniref:ATP adenylyltransferase n=1 Tax=Artomyces pyxidatus TaxID=48021 RepID=A0ACB8T270_9AGAM|nr:ATP adenylyltransferase [Artomyces pyxidatus]